MRPRPHATHSRPACWTLLILAILSFAVQAKAATFTTRLDVDGDEAQITWSLSGGDAEGDPRFPDFQGLKRISGPSVVTSMNLINGKASREKSWTMTFINPTGKAVRLGPATIKSDGQTLGSQPVTVPASGQGSGAAGGGDSRPARLSFEIEPRRPVVGQAVRLKLRLDFNVNVRGYDPPQLPSAQGFVAEMLERPQTPSVSQRTVNGQSWNTAILAEWVLFPVKDGRLRLEPMALNLQVEDQQRRRGRDPFDFFGGSMFNRLKTLALSTEPTVLEVAALPGGAPVAFGGAVGTFSFKAKPDRTELKAGEALTLTVDIEGTGYFSGVEMPALNHSPDLERYDTQTESSVKSGARGQSGRKRFKTLIVPRLPGSQRIEALSFAWYDPAAGAYRTASAGPWTIEVAPGEGGAQAGPGVASAPGGKVQSYGSDIGLVLSAPKPLPLRRAPVHHRWPWLVGMLFALLLTPAAMGFASWRNRQAHLAPALRVRGARRQLRQRLKAAPGQVVAQEAALRGYLADRLGRAATGLLLEDCRRELSYQSAPPELIQQLEELWRKLEFARYSSGHALPDEELQKVADDLEAWFNRSPSTSRRASASLLILGLLCAASSWAATPEARFDQALTAYSKGEFAGAASEWQALVDEGYGSAELQVNLGNAYFRLGDAGRAVLGWERALWLDPRQRDARANLDLIRPRLADQLEQPVRLPLWSWLDGLLAALPTPLVAWSTLLLALASGAVGAWRMVRAERRLPAAGRLLLGFVLVPALVGLLVLGLQDHRLAAAPRAVVLDAKVEVRSAPSPGAVAQFDLHSGTVVTLLRQGDKGWHEVALPDGRSGWTPATALESVKLPLAP